MLAGVSLLNLTGSKNNYSNLNKNNNISFGLKLKQLQNDTVSFGSLEQLTYQKIAELANDATRIDIAVKKFIKNNNTKMQDGSIQVKVRDYDGWLPYTPILNFKNGKIRTALIDYSQQESDDGYEGYEGTQTTVSASKILYYDNNEEPYLYIKGYSYIDGQIQAKSVIKYNEDKKMWVQGSVDDIPYHPVNMQVAG